MEDEKLSEKISIEKLLKEGRTVQFRPIGSSMNPLFASMRDYAIVAPIETLGNLKRGDVVLYRRPNGGILVLHRVYKRKGHLFFFVGDHQVEIEGPLDQDCLLGKMVAMERKGRKISTSNIIYLTYSHIWLFLRPYRNQIYPILDRLNRFVKRKG